MQIKVHPTQEEPLTVLAKQNRRSPTAEAQVAIEVHIIANTVDRKPHVSIRAKKSTR